MSEQGDFRRAGEFERKSVRNPTRFTQDEVLEVLELLSVDHPWIAPSAGTSLRNLAAEPEVLKPVLAEMLEHAPFYPPEIDGIPAPVNWFSDVEISTPLYIAEAIADLAKHSPETLVTYGDMLTNIIRDSRNQPVAYVIAAGRTGSADPDSVDLELVKSRLYSLLNAENKKRHRRQAADTLRRIGQPDVLPNLIKHKPPEPLTGQEGAGNGAFRTAIKELQ